MRVKMILPALTEARSPFFRPIKYSLFPPLGLATLAGYLGDDDEVTIQDEHVERLILDDEPDLVVIQVYITSARRSYEIADHYRRRGARVVLGGLHVTPLPEEAARHADAIFLGPGEDTWPRFLADLRAGNPASRYVSRQRTLLGVPPIRRDLIHRHRYLVPTPSWSAAAAPTSATSATRSPSSRAASSSTHRPSTTTSSAIPGSQPALAGDLAGRRHQGPAGRPSPSPRLRRRLEEVRAALGRPRPEWPGPARAARAGGDPGRRLGASVT